MCVLFNGFVRVDAGICRNVFPVSFQCGTVSFVIPFVFTIAFVGGVRRFSVYTPGSFQPFTIGNWIMILLVFVHLHSHTITSVTHVPRHPRGRHHDLQTGKHTEPCAVRHSIRIRRVSAPSPLPHPEPLQDGSMRDGGGRRVGGCCEEIGVGEGVYSFCGRVFGGFWRCFRCCIV